jgi:hypothetical protein
MGNVVSKEIPTLECRELSAYATDDLDSVRAAFQQADGCVLRQAWLAEPEKDFTPATVRVGWYENSLRVFAEMEDMNIFTRATSHNQRMWELGSVLEIFLQPAGSPSYVELHVTPNNQRLQLRFPDAATVRRPQAANFLDRLMLPDGVFHSQTWTHPEMNKWCVHADIPALLVCGALKLTAEKTWRFSFSRYAYPRGRQEPVISSSSPHAQPDFHRGEEWGTLSFRRRK